MKSSDLFAQDRRTNRSTTYYDNLFVDVDGISQIKENFFMLLNDFPDSDLDCLQSQLDDFCSLFKLIASNKKILNDFQLQSFSFIQDSDFSSIIYSLIMNQTLTPVLQKKLLIILSYLVSDIFSSGNLTFIEDEEFLDQLLTILKTEDESFLILHECIRCIINILNFYPNSIFLLDKSGIINYIATEVIKLDDMVTISESSRFILKVIQCSTDAEQKIFLLHQTILKLIDTMEKRPLTYLLQSVLNCMTEFPDIRFLLVEENICSKCVNIILMMKRTNKFSQFYGDYCIQILSNISNEGTETEFQILLDSNVFEAFFKTEYNFLDISPKIHVDSDSFEYICSFLIGVIIRNDLNANQLLCQYEIFQSICNVFFNGPTDKKSSSLFVIASAVETFNTDICQLLLDEESIYIIGDLLSTMNSKVLQKTLYVLLKIIDLMPEAKEIYIQSDLSSKLEALIMDRDCEEEELNEIEYLLSFINENTE